MAVPLTDRGRNLMRHALGLENEPKRGKRAYRNHFCAGGKDVDAWEELEANSISFDRMRRGIEKHAAIREAEESLAEMKAIAELLSSLSGREWMDAQKRWDAAKRRYDNAVAAFQRVEKAHGE